MRYYSLELREFNLAGKEVMAASVARPLPQLAALATKWADTGPLLPGGSCTIEIISRDEESPN